MDGDGRTRSWYKAVGDARLHASHWTCIMDMDLERQTIPALCRVGEQTPLRDQHRVQSCIEP
jgi:hypothetical protein